MTSGRFTFVTCGSVDDGKSTLIGRMLYDAGKLYDDQIDALKSDSNRFGTQGESPDYALLLDGLQDEREQGITIDVAFRYFSTSKRDFMIADSPGHEQYTRNMATAASIADAAVVLVDVRNGIMTQTARHIRILAAMGVCNVALAVNKMDLINWGSGKYEEASRSFSRLANILGLQRTQTIPTSALTGENIYSGTEARWYRGPTLIEWLEDLPINQRKPNDPLRLPIQYALRRDSEFRGYLGTVAQGSVKPGDRVIALPSGAQSLVKEVITAGKRSHQASSGESICISLQDELDVSRGDIISCATAPMAIGSRFRAALLWLHETPMVAGTEYLFKIHHATVGGTVISIEYKVEMESGAECPTEQLLLNDLATVDISLNKAVPYAAYCEDRRLGNFILIDKITKATVAAGMIKSEIKPERNVTWQPHSVNKSARSAQKNQKSVCIWLTGLPGSGKSTLGDALEKRLFSKGLHTYLLDGDNLRHGLNRDLGFSETDRAENTRRIAETAKLIVDAGLIAIVAIISPFHKDREQARKLFEEGEFIEVYVDTPLEICEERDPKGLYKKSRQGEIPNFTGVSSPYEPPAHPQLHLMTTGLSVEDCVDRVLPLIPLLEE